MTFDFHVSMRMATRGLNRTARGQRTHQTRFQSVVAAVAGALLSRHPVQLAVWASVAIDERI